MRSAHVILRAAVIVALLSGCGAGAGAGASAPPNALPVVGDSPAVTPSAMPASPDPSVEAALEARAAQVLGRWAAARPAGTSPSVIPVGDMTGQIGDWEPAVGDNNKRALMAGQIFSDADLTVAGTPAAANVVRSNGTTVSVPIIGAQEALVAIGKGAGPSAIGSTCDGCTPLTAVSAALTSGPFQTTQGRVTGPVWVFSIRGTAVRVTRIALANVAPVAGMADDPGGALGIDAAWGSVNGAHLSVRFVGAPDPGDKPCGEDYTAQAVESDLAVTVIVTRHPFTGFLGACAAVGAYRTATATLAKPLGDRVVLDLASGLPVTLERQP